MVGNGKKMKPLFLAAFIFLGAITFLLLAFSIQFFAAPSVWMQFDAWAMQSPLGAVIAQIPGVESPTTISPAATSTPGSQSSGAQYVALGSAQSGSDLVPTEQAPTPTVRIVEDEPPTGSLVIPLLDVDQPLVTVPVNGQEWDLSTLGTDVGWLQTTGTHPGDDLAMVFIGHVTLPAPGGAGPFLNLAELKLGDIVEYRSRDKTYVYQVKTREIVSPDHINRLYVADGNRLLLVTCTGYNPLAREYDLRLVVEAVLTNIME
jgi:LPXTG-site transpeptidase (sortase) family protein